MKYFLKLILLFFIPIILVAISMEIILRRIPNDYSYKSNYLEKHSNQVETLYLGSSHIFFGISPKYMSKNSFNAAHVSQSLDYDYAILKKYKNNWANLKCIVVPVDYFTLYYSLEAGLEAYRIKNYNIYYGIHNSTRFADNFEIFNSKFSDQLKRAFDYLKSRKSDMNCDSLGWGTIYHSNGSKNLDTTGVKAALRHSKTLETEKYFKNNEILLNNIILFARNKNIEVVFVSCPAYKSYRQHLNPEQLQTTINTISELCKGHAFVKYYNLLDDKSFIDKDFYDADHLNEIGAKKMSLIMDSLVNK